MAVDQRVVRTQRRLSMVRSESAAKSPSSCRSLNELRSSVFSRPPFRRALPRRAWPAIACRRTCAIAVTVPPNPTASERAASPRWDVLVAPKWRCRYGGSC